MMTIFPSFEEFFPAYDAGRPRLVWTRIVSDLETPVSAMLKLAAGRRNSFLLESVEGGAIRGRYSFIGLKPDLIWRCRGELAEINREALINPDAFSACAEGALDSLRSLIAECRIDDLPPQLPPMAASLVGYMGYDMVRLMERLPNVPPDPIGTPDGMFVRPTVMLVFDTIEDHVTVVTPVWPRPALSARAAYEAAIERIGDVLGDLERSLPHSSAGLNDFTELPAATSNVSPERFEEMVLTAKEYIRAGDAFQIVPSQRFSVPFELPPFSLYRALRRLNPSPFLFFLDFGDFAVVGSSPEILVRVRDEKVTIRPLAGTRRRGKDAAEDRLLSQELLSDPKEMPNT